MTSEAPPSSSGGHCPIPAFMFRGIRLNPDRALEPARRKLETLEAQRVVAVFEETIRRVQIVTALPYIMQNMDRFSVPLGTELVELMRHHSVVISSYDEIHQELNKQLEKRASKKTSPAPVEDTKESEEAHEEETARVVRDSEGTVSRQGSDVSQHSAADSRDSQLAATMRNLSLVAEQMSDSTRNILRAFTRNPPAMIMVTDQMIERDVVDQVLIRYLRELRDILMRKLLTTPQEENEHMGYLAEMVKREQQTAVVIEKLEHELSANIDEKEYETKRKNDLIKRLQTELHQVGKLSEEHIRRIRADAEKQEAADEKNSAGKQEKLKADVVHLRAQLLNSTTEHRKREAELRGKKYIIESEVENWILKYDEELGVRQDEYEEVDKVYKVEKKQLEELEERFATLEKEYLAIIANRRLAREKRLKEERVQEYLEKAATTIQSFWRSHKVFKAIDLRKKKQARKEQKAKKGKKGKKGKDN